MSKYLDADILRAEIERRIDETINIHHTLRHRREELEGLLSFIDSLQQEQPEVDIRKELYAYICSDEYLNTREDGSLLIARHFFELGQKDAANKFDEIEYNRQRATSAIAFEYRIIGRNAIENLDMIELENAGISWGDEVIVQIMKKEGSK